MPIMKIKHFIVKASGVPVIGWDCIAEGNDDLVDRIIDAITDAIGDIMLNVTVNSMLDGYSINQSQNKYQIKKA